MYLPTAPNVANFFKEKTEIVWFSYTIKDDFERPTRRNLGLRSRAVLRKLFSLWKQTPKGEEGDTQGSGQGFGSG